jgi:hypothetical protein
MTSKFANLKAMRENRQDKKIDEAPSTGVTSPKAQPASPETPRRVGRPAGKRSDPNFQQVTVLLHQDTYRETRKRLLDERKEVSTLINELLDRWLKS